MAQIQEVFLYTPTTVPGCALWLDASDLSTIGLTESTVTSWADKSGNGKNISIAGTLTYSNMAVNTASDLTSYFTTEVDIRKTVQPNVSVFIVYKWLAQGTGATAQTFWGNDVPNAANRVQFLDFSAVYNPNSYGYFLFNGYLTNSTELDTPNQQIYGLISQVGVTDGTGVYFNGTLGSAGTGTELVNSPDPGNATLYFGGGETAGIFPSYTQFNEILVYTTAFTTVQRQQIEGYLAWKWNLVSSLPANHPYKTGKPLAQPPFPIVGVPPMPLRITNVTPFLYVIPPVRGSLRSWAPTQVPGCQMWLDGADQRATVLTGTAVTQWLDKSGNGNNLTPVGIYSNATIAYAYQNKLNVLDFTGSNVYQSPANSGAYPTDVFFVIALKAGATRADILSLTAASADDFTAITTGAYGTDYEWNQASTFGSRSFNTGYTESVGRFVMMNWTLADYNMVLRRNTDVLRSADSYVWSKPTNAIYSLGLRIDPYVYWGGVPDIPFDAYVAEIIAYSSVLSVYQRQLLEGNLAWKWGLQSSLPANHPYKLFPPPP